MVEPERQNQINEWIDEKLKEYEVDEDRLEDLRAKVKCYTGIKKYWKDYMEHLKSVGRNGSKVWEWCEREKKSIIKVLEHYEKQIARHELVDNLKKFRKQSPPPEIL